MGGMSSRYLCFSINCWQNQGENLGEMPNTLVSEMILIPASSNDTEHSYWVY